MRDRLVKYLAVVDVETTGVDPQRHEVLQVARVVIDVEHLTLIPELQYNGYIRPTNWKVQDRDAMRTHRLTWMFLEKNGAVSAQVLRDFSLGINWETTFLAGWAVYFDAQFLTEAFRREKRVVPFDFRLVDIKSIALDRFMSASRWQAEVAPIQVKYQGLRETCEWLGLDFDVGRQHDALYDVQVTAEVWIELQKRDQRLYEQVSLL